MSSLCPCLFSPAQRKQQDPKREDAHRAQGDKAAASQSKDKKKRSNLTNLWTALEKEDENNFLDQHALIERAAPALRARFTEAPDPTSAVSVAAAAGVSSECQTWGSDMTVPASYKGPRITWPLTVENVREVVRHIRIAPKAPIHQKYVAELLGRSITMFKEQLKDSVFDMSIPPRAADGSLGKLVVCGDTHGHLEDFLYVLSQNGEPSEQIAYLMNGDVADRGYFSAEILIICLLYKLLFPNSVMINRGNHENMEINRRRSDEGGGFYDEVMHKYSTKSSDQSIFYMFQQLFELLPLATVVANKVFVVHGGLFRHEGVLINDVRKLERRRQCPTTTTKKEDAMMFDTMWADPHELNGVMRSQRGPNCIRFGPDVTEKFLRNNSLTLVIRSHEVPLSNRGYEESHNKKLVTLFTASDYCGYTGNSGAVMVLDSDMSCRIREHMAWMKEGDLASPQKADRADNWCFAGETIQMGGPDTKSFDLPRGGSPQRSRTEIERSIAQKLKTQVVNNKEALFQYWSRADGGKPVAGRVSLAAWRAGICKVLELADNLPWDEVEELILEPGDKPERDVVDYRRFIASCTQAISKPGGAAHGNEEIKRQVINKFYETIIRSDFTLRETLSQFDRDGDGSVSADELRQYLYEAHSDLPEVQIDAILRVMSYESGDSLTLDKFLSRFQVVYKDNNASRLPKDVVAMLTEVGRRLLVKGSRVEVFEQIDTDGNGYVEEAEFHAAVRSLGLAFSPAQQSVLWKAIDLNGDGHLNFVEFCSSFEASNAGASGGGGGDDAGREVWESIVASLKRNTQSLDHIWRTLDPRNTGRVPVADFKDGFRALNASLVGRRVLTDDQLDVIVDYLDKDKDGTVDYIEWMECFG